MTFLGIDLGTSAVKAVLVDGEQRVLAAASAPLAVDRPGPGRSEQDPERWWEAVLAVVDRLRAERGAALAAVRGIGLSGQMHGAVLLDAAGAVLRPAILWNDVRAEAECAALEAAWPELRRVTGNLPMPGFTAPKLLWVRRHEPETWARLRLVLLPKAWLRFRLTGEAAEDMSDASGTLWLDVAARDWSDAALAATGLGREHVPRLVEGNAPAGLLRPELAARWGMGRAVLAGGAVDNAAGAVGVSAIRPGDALVSLGTSGVLFATTGAPRFFPERAVHAFCHALPGTWHQMGVTLSAAASLAWWAGVAGRPEAELLAELPPVSAPSPALFAPFLGGERTPHNDGALRGAFLGLGHGTDRPALTQAVLEGVAFALADGLDALTDAGSRIDRLSVIGGGARSAYWGRIVAAALETPLVYLRGGEVGPALGAARLAQIAVDGGAPADVCAAPPVSHVIEPDAAIVAALAEKKNRFRAAYPRIAANPKGN